MKGFTVEGSNKTKEWEEANRKKLSNFIDQRIIFAIEHDLSISIDKLTDDLNHIIKNDNDFFNYILLGIVSDIFENNFTKIAISDCASCGKCSDKVQKH